MSRHGTLFGLMPDEMLSSGTEEGKGSLGS
jgi:hypothetical protein